MCVVATLSWDALGDVYVLYTGPPESMREHVVAASNSMREGNWKACRDYILAIKVGGGGSVCVRACARVCVCDMCVCAFVCCVRVCVRVCMANTCACLCTCVKGVLRTMRIGCL